MRKFARTLGRPRRNNYEDIIKMHITKKIMKMLNESEVFRRGNFGGFSKYDKIEDYTEPENLFTK
jgi:hypothetical protein